MAALTEKQENFCQAYIETGNASEAYRQSYNAENMKPKTINERASRLLKECKISARVNDLQDAHTERHNVTVDNGAGGAAVNIQDGGNVITVYGTKTEANSDAFRVTKDGILGC